MTILTPRPTPSSMPPSPNDSRPFLVEGVRVDPLANEVERDRHVERLEPKVMEVLVYLASRPGETVVRDEIFEAVWADVVVTDSTLTRCISQLRAALGDDARDPQVIETIPKVGYRFVGSVTGLPEAEAPRRWGLPDSPTATPSPDGPGVHLAAPGHSKRTGWIAGLVVLVAIAVGTLVWSTRSGPVDAPVTDGTLATVDMSRPVSVTYAVEANGGVNGAVLTFTDGGDEWSRLPVVALPFRRTVEFDVEHGQEIGARVEGVAQGAEVLLTIEARQGSTVVAKEQARGQFADNEASAFRLGTSVVVTGG